jgi:uncharacterized protein YdcH (DUF465 family)
MSHVPHELHEEFPNDIERLREMRQSNTHVARLMDEYHELNRTLHRGETNVEPMADSELTQMRKQRLMLKDEIARLLRSESA